MEIPNDSHLDLCLEQEPRLVSTRSQRFLECSAVAYEKERRAYSRCKTPGYKGLYQSHLNLARPNQTRLYISLVCFLRLYPALKNWKNFQGDEQKGFVLRGDSNPSGSSLSSPHLSDLPTLLFQAAFQYCLLSLSDIAYGSCFSHRCINSCVVFSSHSFHVSSPAGIFAPWLVSVSPSCITTRHSACCLFLLLAVYQASDLLAKALRTMH